MRFLLILLLASTSLACEGCDDGRLAPPPPHQEVSSDASADVQAAPLMVLHYTEDWTAVDVGPTFNEIVGSVPTMQGGQGPGVYLPFLAVLSPDAPLLKERRVTVDVRVVYSKTGRVYTTFLKRQWLEQTKDPDHPESLIYWGYVGLYPEEFDQSGTLELSLEVTLSDDSGNAVTDLCPVIRVRDGSEESD